MSYWQVAEALLDILGFLAKSLIAVVAVWIYVRGRLSTLSIAFPIIWRWFTYMMAAVAVSRLAHGLAVIFHWSRAATVTALALELAAAVLTMGFTWMVWRRRVDAAVIARALGAEHGEEEP